jgi:hypothetical protein
VAIKSGFGSLILGRIRDPSLQRKLAFGAVTNVPINAVKLQEVTCPISKLFAKSFETSLTWRDMQWCSVCSESPRSSPDAVSSHAGIYLLEL